MGFPIGVSASSSSSFGLDEVISITYFISNPSKSWSTFFSALLCKISALRSFALDKLHYWRESASGISSLAYFLSKDTIDHFNTLVKPLVYLSMFYFFNNPRSSVLDNYIILVCLVYCVTGIAYTFAIFLEPGPAQLVSIYIFHMGKQFAS